MNTGLETFRENFGFAIPEEILSLYHLFDGEFPITLGFKNVGYSLEIQYLLDINDVTNYNIDEGRLSFAISSDGHTLIIDLRSENYEILQDEFGDIDSIGINVNDILESEKV